MNTPETSAEGSAYRARPRLQDVADRVGMSTASVSLVLRGVPGPSAQTRERVLAAAEQLGYQPDRNAQVLASRRSRLLGVMIDIHSPFHAELVDHLHAEAEKAGYDLVLSTVTPRRDERAALQTLLSFGSEALILLGPIAPPDALRVLDERLPTVVVGRRIAGDPLDVVRTADADGVGGLVEHLVALGHRRIAYVDGGKGVIATDRRRGYRLAMRRQGLAEHAQVVAGDTTEKSGEAAARRLAQQDILPTAVLAYNDPCAVGVLTELTRLGLSVPRDISVAGYDNAAISQLGCFDLTTVSQSPAEQAGRAVEIAVERLDGSRTMPREVILPPRLVIRGSTAEVSGAPGSR
ncbi:LacI family DNA-binding transcriptional regulator [Streptomyces sp. NPDC090106]|uniref:LacI family DNA-binding transcriptional regulator n=1 Tax=Streptomyces sp. NPDC090106 TaxID=3365946 RepID=UPI0037F7DE2A